MFNLIPLSLLIMALAGVIYIVSNHLSEFSAKGGSASGEEDEKDEPSLSIRAKFADWISRLPLDNVKSYSLSFTQKLLHRIRIVLLKTDNYLMKLIGRISESEKDKTAPNDFWKDFSNYKQEGSSQKNSKSEPEVKIDLALKGDLEKKFFDIKPVKKAKIIKKSPR